MIEMGSSKVFCSATYVLTGLGAVMLFWLMHPQSGIHLVGASAVWIRGRSGLRGVVGAVQHGVYDCGRALWRPHAGAYSGLRRAHVTVVATHGFAARGNVCRADRRPATVLPCNRRLSQRTAQPGRVSGIRGCGVLHHGYRDMVIRAWHPRSDPTLADGPTDRALFVDAGAGRNARCVSHGFVCCSGVVRHRGRDESGHGAGADSLHRYLFLRTLSGADYDPLRGLRDRGGCGHVPGATSVQHHP